MSRSSLVGMFRPPRLNAAGVCFWCACRWCSSAECEREYQARTFFAVCPVCQGGIGEEYFDQCDRELLAILEMDHLVGPDPDRLIRGDCRRHGCVGGVVQVASAEIAELAARKYVRSVQAVAA